MEIKNSKRNLGIDLFRIFSMLMVVILHILTKGGLAESAEPNSLNFYVVNFMKTASFCAVNCYAIISGYVGLQSRHRPANLAMLWLQVAFWSILITLIMHFSLVPTNIVFFAKSFLPVTGEMYWYFTSYFAMWFFIPFMNAAIDNLPKRKAGIYLIVSGLILLSISFYKDRFYLNQGYSCLWLCYLYLIGAYISKHKLFINVSAIKSLLVYFSCALITFCYTIFLPTLSNIIPLITYISPINVIASISLLVFFINLKISDEHSKIITTVSSVSFGVYLIHTHPVIFDHLFFNAFSFLAYKSPIFLILGIVACALSIFITCAFVDYIRLWLFKILKIKQLLNIIFNWAEKCLNALTKHFSKSS